MIDLQPSLLIVPAEAGVQIEARIRSNAPGPVPWRLVIEVAGPAGRSTIRQAGVSDGSGGVVARSAVNADAVGRAVLQAEAPDGSTREATMELKPAGQGRR